jgi:hypothetical protein
MPDNEIQPGPCYRTGPITRDDYMEVAMEMMEAAAMDETRGCSICGDSGHGGGTCHHNALALARRWVAATSVYRCFHCDYVAANDAEASEHFGTHEGEFAACVQSEVLQTLGTAMRKFAPDLAAQLAERWNSAVAADNKRLDDFLAFLREPS